jgi:hypothetical protein
MCYVSECVFIGPLPALAMAHDIENTSVVVKMRVYWPVAQHWAWRRPHNTFSIVAWAYLERFLEMSVHVTVHT